MWKDWLALSKREQKGFVVLSTILISLIVFYFLTPLLFSPNRQEGVEADKDIMDWIDSVNTINSVEAVSKPESLFFFDPNNVSISNLQKLGVKGDALINWLKFRESGSRFRVSEDIRKIYSLDSTLTAALNPYVKFSNDGSEKREYDRGYVGRNRQERLYTGDTSFAKEYRSRKAKPEEQFVIEINSADTAEFAVLKGIGAVLSSRIVLYRKALGGFYSVEQLKEVYGMPANIIDENRSYLSVDSIAISKIDINRVSLRRLKRHPYINFYLAKAIVEYRKENGTIKSVDEILSSEEVEPMLKNKLSVYLIVEKEKQNKE